MSADNLRCDMSLYKDLDGLMSVYRNEPRVWRSTDNGVLFTSTYYILLNFLNDITSEVKMLSLQDYVDYYTILKTCTGVDKELHRAPDDTSPDEMDDYLGAYCAQTLLGLPDVPFKLPLRLCRYPNLIVLSLLAGGTFKRILGHVLTPILALTVLFSCLKTPVKDTNSRCLGFIQALAVSKVSFLGRLAANIWFKRLKKDYKGGMHDVYTTYFGYYHPFTAAIAQVQNGRYT